MEVQVRISEYGEFLNSETIYVDETADHVEIMDEAADHVEGRYGDSEAWDEGEVSWTIHY